MLHACRLIIVAPENSDELLKYSDRFRSNPMSPVYSGDNVNPVAIKNIVAKIIINPSDNEFNKFPRSEFQLPLKASGVQ